MQTKVQPWDSAAETKIRCSNEARRMGQETITLKDLAGALKCTETNIRDREGKSMPSPAAVNPRIYRLIEILWMVNGQERELICQAVGIPAFEVRAGMSRVIEAYRGNIPESAYADDDEDPLMG